MNLNIEDFYDDSDSDSEYFLADESLEESQDASCQSFPNGSQGVVGSEKSTLSNCAILGSGQTFGDKIDAWYVLENNLAPIESVTGMKSNSLAPKESVTGMANQGELDEVKSLSTPTTQGCMKSTPRRK